MKAKFCKLAFAVVLLLIIALFGACGENGENEYDEGYDLDETASIIETEYDHDDHDEIVSATEIDSCDGEPETQDVQPVEAWDLLTIGEPVEVRHGIIAAGETVSFILRDDGSLWAQAHYILSVKDNHAKTGLLGEMVASQPKQKPLRYG